MIDKLGTTAVPRIDTTTESTAIEPLAVQRRRESRREEWREHERLAALLGRYLPENVFWTSLENAPRSRLGGLFARRRGVRAGIPDLLIIASGELIWKVIFIELKSKRGVLSAAQRQVRAELVKVGCSFWLARSARSALAALHKEGVTFKRRWQPSKRLRPWEGPFLGTEKRLPQHPQVARERRAARRRWRLRQANREREAAKLAAKRNDAASGDIAA